MLTRTQIDDLQRTIRLSAIIGDIVTLKPSGNELTGLCPFHTEKTPSFYVNDAKGLYNCFGCGAGGDAIAFVMHIYDLGFTEAASWLADGEHLVLTPVERAETRERDEANRTAATREARLQWNRSIPTTGTPADLYLGRRGIISPPPPSIRFVMAPLRKGEESDGTGRRLPALIAAAISHDSRLMAVHRIFLTADGQKAPLTRAKLSLGDTDGCAVRLGDADVEITLCEGIEDGLTLRQRFPDMPVWIALGTGRMHKLDLPDRVRKITIAADNDEAGRIAAERARETYEAAGRQVVIIRPPLDFKDWNDELCQILISQE